MLQLGNRLGKNRITRVTVAQGVAGCGSEDLGSASAHLSKEFDTES